MIRSVTLKLQLSILSLLLTLVISAFFLLSCTRMDVSFLGLVKKRVIFDQNRGKPQQLYSKSLLGISGTVTEFDELTPIAGARVTFSLADKPAEQTFIRSDVKGAFRVMLHEGIYDVSAAAQGYKLGRLNNVRLTLAADSDFVRQAALPPLDFALLRNDAAATMGTLSGKILGWEEAPAGSCRLYVKGSAFFKTVSIAADGSWRIDLPAGRYSLSLSSDLYPQIIKNDIVVNPGLINDQNDFTLVPGISLLTGLVKSSADSAGLAGLHVALQLQDSPSMADSSQTVRPVFSVTGADGSFKFDHLKTGKYELVLWGNGCELITRQLIISAEDPNRIEIFLHRGVEIRDDGGFVGTITGRLVATDELLARQWSVFLTNEQNKVIDLAHIDPTGGFLLRDVAPGFYTIAFDTSALDDVLIKDNNQKTAVESGDTSFVTFSLSQLMVLTGVVHDDVGKPAAGCQIYLAYADGQEDYFDIADAEGRFKVTGMHPGKYKVTARYEDYPDYQGQLSCQIGVPNQLTIELVRKRLTTIYGKVTQGKVRSSLPGIQIAAFNAADSAFFSLDTTAADGSYMLQKLAPGEYTVYASSPDITLHQTISVTGNDTQAVLDFSFPDDPFTIPGFDSLALSTPYDLTQMDPDIIIRVISKPDKRSVNHAQVEYFSDESQQFISSVPMDDGRYLFEQVQGGKSVCRVAAAGFASVRQPIRYDPGLRPLTTTIVLEPNSRIHGHASDTATGEPVQELLIYLLDSEKQPLAGHFALSDQEGYYAFYDIPAGIYYVMAGLNGYLINEGSRVVLRNEKNDITADLALRIP